MRDRFSSTALSRMGRRGFLKTLTTLGVSASTASVLTQDAVADVIDDPKREVPRIKAFVHTSHEEVAEDGAEPERVPDVYTIPRSMWVRVEAARDARQKVEKQIDGQYPVWVSEDNNGEKTIVVEQPDNGNLRSTDIQMLDEQVPSSVVGVAGGRSGSGRALAKGVADDLPKFGRRSRFAEEREIPVDIERPRVDQPIEQPRVRKTMDESCMNQSTSAEKMSYDTDESLTQSGWDEYVRLNTNHYLADWEDVPGGASVGFWDPDTGLLETGTTGTPATYNGSRVLITAGHLLTPIKYNGSEYPTDGAWIDKIGIDTDERVYERKDLEKGQRTVKTWKEDGKWSDVFDVGILHPGSANVSQGLANDSGGTHLGVGGSLTQDRLYDLQDGGSDADLYKQGSMTGRDQCSITDVNDHSFKYSLKVGSDVIDGDSGGPIFEEDNLSFFGFEIPVALIGGIHKGGYRYEDAFATSMPAIENHPEFGVTV